MRILLVAEHDPQSVVAALSARNCAVHVLSIDEALMALRGSAVTADVIVFVPESSVFDVADVLACTVRFVSGVMLEGDAFAVAVRELPGYCTMPDGRRWNRIPMFIYLHHQTDNGRESGATI